MININGGDSEAFYSRSGVAQKHCSRTVGSFSSTKSDLSIYLRHLYMYTTGSQISSLFVTRSKFEIWPTLTIDKLKQIRLAVISLLLIDNILNSNEIQICLKTIFVVNIIGLKAKYKLDISNSHRNK